MGGGFCPIKCAHPSPSKQIHDPQRGRAAPGIRFRTMRGLAALLESCLICRPALMQRGGGYAAENSGIGKNCGAKSCQVFPCRFVETAKSLHVVFEIFFEYSPFFQWSSFKKRASTVNCLLFSFGPHHFSCSLADELQILVWIVW